MKLRWLLPFMLALPLAAQTFTLTPGNNCGLTLPVRCYNVPIAEGGNIWIDTTGHAHDIQFNAVGPNQLLSTASTGPVSITTIVPLPKYPVYANALNNSFVFEVPFSGVDQAGQSYSGSLTITYHYQYLRGSGRGGGGSGNHLIIDSGEVTIN